MEKFGVPVPTQKRGIESKFIRYGGVNLNLSGPEKEDLTIFCKYKFGLK